MWCAKYFFVFAALFATTFTLNLPNYIQPCSLTDPKLNECALRSTRNSLPIIVKGDRRYKLPRLDPMNVPEILIQSGENLKVKLSQLKIHGIGSADIKSVILDMENKFMSSEFRIERFNMLGKYFIRGTILSITVEGQGPLNITMDGANFKYSFNFNLRETNGEKYISPVDPKVDFETERSYFVLGNLFNGDALLGAEVNTFLDENWQDVQNELKPDVSDAISAIITSIARSYFDRIPLKDMFLP